MENIELVKFLRRVKLLVDSNQLIGLELYKIVDKSELIKAIHERAMYNLRCLTQGMETSQHGYAILSSLCLIALEEYDGNFWDRARDTYENLYSRHNESKQGIERRIRKLLEQYYEELAADSRKINPVICNALVPINYLDEFYKIMLDIYLHDFHVSLPEDDEELDDVLDNIFSQIVQKEYSEDDKFQSAALNKSYKMIKSTRDVIKSKKHRRTFTRFARHIIKSIENVALVSSKKDNTLPYLQSYAEQWYELHGRVKFENNTAKTRKNRLRWKPELKLENQQLFLCTRTIFLPSNIDTSNIKIVVYSGEKIVYEDDHPEIIENALSYELSSVEIPVNWNPFNMTYRIEGLEVDPVIFDDDFYMFDENYNQVKSNYAKKDNLYIVMLKEDMKDKKVHNLGETKHYKVGYIDTDVVDYLQIGDKSITLLDVEEPILQGDFHSYVHGKIINSEEFVYQSNIHIAYPIDKQLQTAFVNINGKYMPLDINRNYSSGSVTLNHLLEYGLNIVEINLVVNEETISKKWTIIYDPAFSVDVSTLDNIKYHINVHSSQFNDDLQNQKYTFDANKESEFFVNFSKYLLYIELKVPMIKRDGRSFKPIENSIWHEDVKYYDQVEIKGIFADKIKVIGKASSIVYKTFEPDDDKKRLRFNFDLGILKSLNVKSKENFTLEFLNNGEVVETIDFMNHSEIESNAVQIIYDDIEDAMNMSIESFKGKGSLAVEIYHDDVCIMKNVVSETPYKQSYKGFNSFENYDIRILDETSRKLLYRSNPLIFKKRDMPGKDFKVVEVYVDITEKVKKRNKVIYKSNSKIACLRKTYLRITEYLSEQNIYAGKIYYENRYGEKKFFSKIDNVFIEIDDDITNKKFNANVTFDEEMLYFDPQRERILDDPDAEEQKIKIGTVYDLALTLR